MTPEQVEHRQALLDRNDAALERWPQRTGRQFLAEMSAVAQGLEALAKEADAAGDRFERCRTWRAAGNAYFDLANAKDLPQLRNAVSAFEKAERLLEGIDNAAERLKLNYSFGHALFHLSGGRDVTLVQQARDRYAVALTLARRHLPAAVDTAQEALTSAERLLAATQSISQLDSRMSELKRQLQEPDDAPAPIGEWRDDMKGLFGELQDVYAKDIADGDVSAVDQEALNPVLDALGSMLGQNPTTLADLTSEGSRLQELMARVAPLLGRTGQSGRAGDAGALESGSRADAVWARMATIKKDLAADIARPHSGSDERSFGMELYVRCGHADTFVHQNGSDEAKMREYEQDVLRQLAADVRAYSVRYHLTLAQPVWSSAPLTPDPNGVFYSGGGDVRELVSGACERLGLTLLATRSPKDYAAARWDQCRTGQVAVFDFTRYRRPDPLSGIDLSTAGATASVSYDLGMAMALGRPVVIIANDDQDLPFDVNVEPLRLQHQGAPDDGNEARLAEALDDALYSSRAGDLDGSLSAARDYLEMRFARHPNVIVAQSARLLDDASTRDPVVFRRFVEPLLGAAGREAPLMVFPAWPGSYPEPLEPRLFHVTPFGPSWAADTMHVAGQVCGRTSPRVDYIRGDQVLDPDIIRSIWDHLSRATHVLVDLTSLNANVAFELAVAHVLGRHVLLVSQDENVRAHFPALAKTRIHEYHLGGGSGGSSLDYLIGRFLAETH